MASSTSRERASTAPPVPWRLQQQQQQQPGLVAGRRWRSQSDAIVTRTSRPVVDARIGLSLSLDDDSSSLEDEESLVMLHPGAGGRAPAPRAHVLAATATTINWSHVYSSDDETEHYRRPRQRSYSEPSLDSLEESATFAVAFPTPSLPPAVESHHQHFHSSNRLRSRNNNSPIIEVGGHGSTTSAAAAVAEDSYSSSSRHRRGSGSSGDTYCWLWIQKCTPFRVLATLFLISCYTTFCLPYPEVMMPERNAAAHQPNFPLFQQQYHLRTGTSSAAGGGLAHYARAASPNVGGGLSYYQQEESSTMTPSPLQRYYQQEGFISTRENAYWTRYANIAALALVLVWAVVEHYHQRRQRRRLLQEEGPRQEPQQQQQGLNL